MIYDFIGIIGVYFLIITYYLLQINKINSKSYKYSFINLIASILIIISLTNTFNLSSFIIEIFWMLISIIGIYYTYKESKIISDNNFDSEEHY